VDVDVEVCVRVEDTEEVARGESATVALSKDVPSDEEDDGEGILELTNSGCPSGNANVGWLFFFCLPGPFFKSSVVDAGGLQR
jgi:hypothetical protein